MLRGGGWAVPLACDAPALVIWERVLRRGRAALCALPGVHCPPPKPLAGLCGQWTPLAIGTCLCAALLVLVWALVVLCRPLRWWRIGQRRSANVAEAAAQLAELRRARPDLYPPTAHAWAAMPPREELAPPLLCAVCFQRTRPGTADLKACEVCGEVAHDGCARKAPPDCRPAACAAAAPAHHWLPAGVVHYESDEEAGPPKDSFTCLYCRAPCDADLFAREPVWACAGCGEAAAHVTCFHAAHAVPHDDGDGDQSEDAGSPDPPQGAATVPMRRSTSIDGRASGPPGGGAGASPTRAQPRALQRHGRTASQGSLQGALASPRGDGKPAGGGRSIRAGGGSGRSRRLDPDVDVREADVCRFGPHGRLVVPASAVRARDDDESSPAAGSWTARAAKFLRAETFQLSDTIARRRPRAHAGDKDPKQKPKDAGSPAGRQASAKPRRRRASTQSPQRRPRGVPAQAGAAVTGAGGGPGSGASAGGSAPDPDTDAAAHSGQTDPPAANGSADAPEGGGKGGCEGGSDGDAQAAAAPKAGDVTEGAGGSPLKALQVKIGPRGPGGAHKHWTPASWWRGQAGGTAWEDYEIRPERLLPGSCPLLVFVNTKSGPQAGAALRRRFLRLLNPLQVVELPREKPEAPLRLFAGVPGLRVLAIGGDGTVAWLLGCLEELGKEREAAGLPWHAPPVGVLPLGTGNDLARCLGWGAGMHVLREGGLPGALRDVEHAAPVPLDRWAVQVVAAPPEPKGKGKGKGGGRAGAGEQARDKKEVRTAKAMNNYLGIGIDAKVALDFHSLREQYPAFFKSQIANKIWYAGMGGKGILADEPLDLPNKLLVEVDGRKLALPEDLAGVMLLNIQSYMGGVDLWAGGDAPAAAEPSTPQSFDDGQLEVVGVYGVLHLGQLQMGLSRAVRLAQCHSARITLRGSVPVQVDGEPWLQPAATIIVAHAGQAMMLQRVRSGPGAAVARCVYDVLAAAETRGAITSAQRSLLHAEIAAKLPAL